MAVSNGFTYTESGGNATITNYDPTSSSYGYNPIIPATLDTYPVTSIAANAFKAKSLASVTFNNSVYLGKSSFYNNSGIDVNLNADVTTDSTIASTTDAIFGACSIADGLTISEGVTTIPYALFYSSGLTSVTFPSTLTTISRSAFHTNSISSVTFDNPIYIEKKAFYSNPGIRVNLDADLTTYEGTYIATDAIFYNCSIADGLTIGEGVTTIPYALFYNSGLTSVIFPSTIVEIKNSCFQNNNIISVILYNVTIIGNGAFAYNANLASFINKNITTSYGTSVLLNCMISGTKGDIYAEDPSTTKTWWQANYTATYNFNAIQSALIEAPTANTNISAKIPTITTTSGVTNVTCTVENTPNINIATLSPTIKTGIIVALESAKIQLKTLNPIIKINTTQIIENASNVVISSKIPTIKIDTTIELETAIVQLKALISSIKINTTQIVENTANINIFALIPAIETIINTSTKVFIVPKRKLKFIVLERKTKFTVPKRKLKFIVPRR
jgi:hypothetical protein